MIQDIKTTSFAPAVIKLLQDALYDDDKHWKDLMSNQGAIIDYFAKIGVKLIIEENEGFAYIYQPDEDEDTPANAKLPRLVKRTPLSYEVTIISVLLREMLEEFDVKSADSVKLFVTNKDIKEKIELFFKDRSNKVKLIKNFDTYINSIINLGFLKVLREDSKDKDNTQYEVKRILKAKINNEKLEEIKQKLNEYTGSI
jgi:hypothetical protein